MSSNLEPERVIDLDAARARKADTGRSPRTIILQVSNVRDDGEAHRQIGVTDSLQLRELHDVLVVCFALGDERAPWSFSSGDVRLDPSDPLYRHLGSTGDSVTFRWGLWEFTVVAAHSWPRDRGTPWALCVGGSGRFGRARFDVAAINLALTGSETTRGVLKGAHPAVRSLIERSRVFDLVPLLQALDLGREVQLAPEVCDELRRLPVETDEVAVDAFWATVLALSCMSDRTLENHVTESVLAALGRMEDDGSAVTGARARQLCRRSLEVLESVGGYGERALAPVDRLDIYRELLRAPGTPE